MKMTKKRDRRITLFVVLIMGFLTGSVGAATIEKEIIVSEKNPINIVFTVEETGVIYAEVELKGAIEEIELVLESPAGEVKREGGEMPLSLKYEVSKDDIAEGTEWKISVRSGLSERADGTLKITYPGDTTLPTIEITCSPENPTAEQQITFIATASSDRSGIDRIEILVNARKVEERFDSYSCTYVGGPYPDYAGTSVSYGANAYDKAGNRAWTGYKSVHISEAMDITPPTVIESAPAGENVPVTTEITVTFSEPMNKKSVESAFSIYPEVPGELYWEDNTLIFTPGSNLDYDTRYVAGIEGGDRGAMDLAGNIMVESYEWDFETISPELVPPTAIISATSGEINEGESVSFSAEASGDQDGYIVSYHWDFGDGDTDTGINVEHTYYHSGHYTATLMVTDNDGLSDTDTEAITVNSIPTLSVSISTNPVPSGEPDEIKVRVFSDGTPVAGANVHLTSTIGSLYPTEGETDEDGVFVSTYTAPLVSTAQRYTISAAAEKEGYKGGMVSVSNSIFVEQPPTTTPAPVVTPTPMPEETPTPAPPSLPSLPIVLIAIAAIATVTVFLIYKAVQHSQIGRKRKEKEQQYGSISASSNPEGAVVSLDGVYQGRSPITMGNIPIGSYIVVFVKFGYFECKREAIVKANQTTHVHCDLTEIPGVKMKLSAEPIKIPADGKSRSTITIRIEDKDEIPIPVPEDVTVELITDKGTVESPVKIPAGRASVTATLTSTKAQGTATVEAKALFLKSCTTIEFTHSTNREYYRGV
ncbi:MAG: PKD domain-containing protein [Methanophagales archaeon]|nr:PKD domain-containing protein [Methanophagales archaeon]